MATFDLKKKKSSKIIDDKKVDKPLNENKKID